MVCCHDLFNGVCGELKTTKQFMVMLMCFFRPVRGGNREGFGLSTARARAAWADGQLESSKRRMKSRSAWGHSHKGEVNCALSAPVWRCCGVAVLAACCHPLVKAPAVKNFAWLPVGVNSNKTGCGSVSLI